MLKLRSCVRDAGADGSRRWILWMSSVLSSSTVSVSEISMAVIDEYAFCVQRIISKMAQRWLRGDSLEVSKFWIKSLFLLYFHTRIYSRHFITLRLNHWWQMEYPGDAFHTFLDLDSVIYLAVNGTVASLPVLIQNIFNCVPKANNDFTGLERHGGKWKITKCTFWGGVSL